MKKISLLFCVLQIIAFTSFSQRKVLIEQFTNSGCPPCAASTPVIASYANANSSQVLMLAYHTSFPYLDSMYYENPLQSDQRVAFYGVPAVPYSVVDGNYFSGGSPAFVSSLSSTISNRLNDAPRYSIQFTTSMFNNGVVSGNVELTSINSQNQNENLIVQIVVVEKEVQKSAYLASPGNNIETEYPWVVRKMLPAQTGTALINTMNGGVDNVLFNWSVNNFKDFNQMRVIAFVQNTITKEVYQAEISTPSGISEIEEVTIKDFVVYPSVSTGFFTVALGESNTATIISVYNILGNKIKEINASGQERIFVDLNDVKPGVYFMRAASVKDYSTRKIIVRK